MLTAERSRASYLIRSGDPGTILALGRFFLNKKEIKCVWELDGTRLKSYWAVMKRAVKWASTASTDVDQYEKGRMVDVNQLKKAGWSIYWVCVTHKKRAPKNNQINSNVFLYNLRSAHSINPL